MARISYPRRDEMPAELAELLGEMPRHAPIEMLAHSPALTAPFLRLAQAQFTGLELAARHRELVILTVAGLVDCDYEYFQHVPISEAAGIDPEDRERIRAGDFDTLGGEDDRTLALFVAAVVRSPRVAEDLLARVRERFRDREIVETLQLVGFYWGLGRLCTVLDLETETPDGLTSVAALSDLR
jgi:alkylhydroperoxidase family enzyme